MDEGNVVLGLVICMQLCD